VARRTVVSPLNPMAKAPTAATAGMPVSGQPGVVSPRVVNPALAAR
jgi:hypothetical protein